MEEITRTKPNAHAIFIVLLLWPQTSGDVWKLFFRLLHARQAIDLHIFHFLLASIRPGDRPDAGVAALSQSDRHRQFHLRKVTPRRHHLAAHGLPVHLSLHPRPNRIAIGRTSHELESNIVMAKLLVISKEDRRAPVLHQYDVQITV